MNVSFLPLLLAMAVTVSGLASCSQPNQVDKQDNPPQSGETSRYLQLSSNEYAYDEDREERREEHRDAAYDEHRRRVAAVCKTDWSYCANNCGNVQDNLCMVDCNNNLNQCLLQP